MSHKFCSRGLNLGSPAYSEIEQSRFQTCIAKYSQAFQIFKEESNIFHDGLEKIENQGGDIYAKLNEYDSFTPQVQWLSRTWQFYTKK